MMMDISKTLTEIIDREHCSPMSAFLILQGELKNERTHARTNGKSNDAAVRKLNAKSANL